MADVVSEDAAVGVVVVAVVVAAREVEALAVS